VPDGIFLSVGFVFLFVAGYNTWQDEHRALSSLRESLKSPNFSGRITTSWWGPRYKNVTSLAATIELTNRSGASSGATEWKMDLRFPNGDTLHGEAPILPREDIVAPVNGRTGSLGLPINAWIPTLTNKALASGDTQAGWFMANFDISEQQLDATAFELSVSCKDAVSGGSHTFTQALPRHPGIHIPGEFSGHPSR